MPRQMQVFPIVLIDRGFPQSGSHVLNPGCRAPFPFPPVFKQDTVGKGNGDFILALRIFVLKPYCPNMAHAQWAGYELLSAKVTTGGLLVALQRLVMCMP